jgi:hypothetical protein
MAEEAGRRKRAAVVVLGDIGRSPRMQYHSLSLANQVTPLTKSWSSVCFDSFRLVEPGRASIRRVDSDCGAVWRLSMRTCHVQQVSQTLGSLDIFLVGSMEMAIPVYQHKFLCSK